MFLFLVTEQYVSWCICDVNCIIRCNVFSSNRDNFIYFPRIFTYRPVVCIPGVEYSLKIWRLSRCRPTGSLLLVY